MPPPPAFRPDIRLLLAFVTCAALTLPAAALAAASDSSAAPPAVPDFSGYQSLLDEFLVTISKKGEPLDTRFDYELLYDQRGRRARMVRTLDQLLAVPPSRMNAKTRIAWAINTYNFVVIDAITENLLVPNRGRLRITSVKKLRFGNYGFFDSPMIAVEGRKYSLDEFERRFVFGDSAAVRVPPDARAHFALVCGAAGCPPLWPRAMRPESLDVQLDQATRNALRLSRHLRFDEQNALLEGSNIFNWSAGDFGGHDKSLPWALKYAPPSIVSVVKKHKLTRFGSFPDWDWNLNQAERKRSNS